MRGSTSTGRRWTAFVSRALGSFLYPPTSPELQYISVTSGFKRMSMETKYVCRGLISLYVSFHNNRTMCSTKLHVRICRVGGGGGRRKKSRALLYCCAKHSILSLLPG